MKPEAPPSQFSLLATRRFLPLFVAQALGAFNDNGLRYAISILIIYDLSGRLGIDGASFIALGTALFIAPYFLFSAIAGQLADKYDKALLARRIKFAEIGIMAVGWLSLYLDQVWFHLAVLFLAGTQAAFFSPVKYGLLPQHLSGDELVGGNGLIEMTTFVSILLGVLFGGYFVLQPGGKAIVGATITGLSIAGYVVARRIPSAPPPVPELQISWRLIAQTRRIIGFAARRSDVLQAVLGISWFWFVGALMLTLFPVFTKEILSADENVANLFVATFTIGIGLGSLLANRLLRAEVSPRYVPAAAVLMTVFLLDLYFAAGPAALSMPGALRGISSVLSGWPGIRIVMDLLFISLFGGLFVVPLNALMQSRAAPPRRARVIAANNVLNALFMTASSVLATIGFRAGMSAPGMFLVLGLANAVVAALCIVLLPRELARGIARQLFRLLHRVEVKGLENYHAAGRRVVIVANHQSWIDGPLLQVFIPDRCSLVVSAHFSGAWWMKPAQWIFDIVPVDPANPLALKKLAGVLSKGRRIVMFPEARISVSGSLMRIYDSPAVLAHLAGARVLPVRIDGAQYSLTSKMRGKLRLRPFPKITVTFLEPVTIAVPVEAAGGDFRERLAQKLYEVMTDAVFRTSNINQHLVCALLDARSAHGGRTKVLEDIARVPMSYSRIIMASFVLGRRLARLTRNEVNVGLLLPNVNGCVVAFFGLHAFGKVPAMLNYSTGALNMSAACAAARIATIVTSRRFIEQAQMEPAVAILSEKARIIYLEDVRANLRPSDKLFGLLAARLPRLVMKFSGVRLDYDAPAVILFTSGSEGVPKGVVLSHRNINANRHQAAARIAFNSSDIAFNALPVFHALGLTGGTLLPLLAGVRTFLYPSPLHYKIVPQLCYEIDATILFGTDTFLTGYARNAHPYDFYSLRYVVAGAERVKDETRNMWMDQFGLRILEGYGATECSPVISVNTPLQFKSGTAGRLLDGMEYRLEPVEGIERGGRLAVNGPNVMLGYLRADNPGVLEPPPDGWYDTGDIVEVDDLGYITILGRARRFAKIAGEMVSLSAVEAMLGQAFPDHVHAVVAEADPKKGEQLVIITTMPDLERKAVVAALKKQGVQELMIPRVIVHVAELPVLGSGKTDYVSLARLARAEVLR